MAYADSRAIDALKIVCDNHNNDVMNKANEIVKGNAIFRDKCAVLEKELYSIMWCSRKPENFEEFREYMNMPEITKINDLWNKKVECSLKYKHLFDKFAEYNNGYSDYCMFLGMVGGIRLMTELHENCTDRDAVLWACMDDMEKASEKGEDYDLETEFKKMKATFISDNINDALNMRLNLDS